MASRPTELAAAHRLIKAVQDLSLARSLDEIREIVRHAAREMTGADGATFVLREGDQCHYCDENAISPLWKGRRFPLETCISGWVMLHREAVALEDIYADARIPADAYRPTFVQSLAMVPIRQASPIGALGNYWAERHVATPEELRLLQALADSTSVAMENIRVYQELESRVRERTAELEFVNRELESFAYSVSHDLRAPVRNIAGYTAMIAEDPACTDPLRPALERIQRCTGRMNELIDDTLQLAKVSRTTLQRTRTNLSSLAHDVMASVRGPNCERRAVFSVAPDLSAEGDPALLRIALENLLSNAWKFTAKADPAEITVGAASHGAAPEYFVRDNGVGFDLSRAARLFEPFQRFHTGHEFPGNGVGLATVHRIVQKHGGRIRVESAPDRGTSIYFTLR